MTARSSSAPRSAPVLTRRGCATSREVGPARRRPAPRPAGASHPSARGRPTRGTEERAGCNQTTTTGRRCGPTSLASVPDAVFHLDRDWRFTYLNAAAERLLGRRADELLGRRLAGVPSRPPVGSVLEQRLAEVLRRRAPRVVRLPARAAGPLVRDPRLRRRRRASPSSSATSTSSARADAAPRAPRWRELTAVLESLPAADGAGRRGRPDRVGQHGVAAPTASCSGSRGVVPGGVGDDYLDCMSPRARRPRTTPTIAEGLDRLRGRARAPRASSTTTTRPGSASTDPLVPAAGLPRRRHPPARRQPHRHHRARAQRAGAGLAGRPRRPHRAAEPRPAA